MKNINDTDRKFENVPKINMIDEPIESFVIIEPEFDPYQIMNDSNNLEISIENVMNNTSLDTNSKFAIVSHYLNYPSKLHYHNYVEIIYVAKGRLVNVINNSVHIMEENNLCILNEKCKHLIANLPDDSEKTLVVNLLIHPDLIKDIFSTLKSVQTSLRLEDFIELDFILLKKEHLTSINVILQRLISEYYQSNYQLNYSVIGFLMIFLEKLLLIHSETSFVYDQITKDFFKIIQKDPTQVTLEVISTELNYSKGYLSRHIKKQTGKTISQLITQEKLFLAEKYLSETTYTMTEIAELINYQSESHFYRIFKKSFQLTPKQYRNLINQ